MANIFTFNKKNTEHKGKMYIIEVALFTATKKVMGIPFRCYNSYEQIIFSPKVYLKAFV